METSRSNAIDVYCELSTCMGIADFTREKNIIGKIFWGFLIILGLGLTIWQTCGTFQQFRKDPTYETTLTKDDYDENDPIHFPNIVICNYNRVKQSVIDQYEIDPKALVYFFQMFPTSYDFNLVNLNLDENGIQEYQTAWDTFKNAVGDIDFLEMLRFFGHNNTETFVYKLFDTMMMDLTNIVEVFNVYGRCWKIIPPNNVPILAGASMGIKMALNPNLPEYMKDVAINNYIQQGFVVQLSYEDDPLMSNPLVLEPGSYGNIAFKISKNRVTMPQYSIRKPKCRDQTNLTILNASYTPQNCIFDCMLKSTYDVCGCILFTNTLEKLPLCNLTSMLRCATGNIRDKPTSETSSFEKVIEKTIVCRKSCNHPCQEYLTVDTDMTTTRFSSNMINSLLPMLQKVMGWNDEVTQSARDIVLLRIYFSTVAMTAIETGEKTPIMTFIGNVGGQLGLWLGISLFTVIQLVYYIVIGFVEKYGHCFTNMKNTAYKIFQNGEKKNKDNPMEVF